MEKKEEKKPKQQHKLKAFRISKWYKADDEDQKFARRQKVKKVGTARLRKSITPGTVLILLTGRFRGKRVVFLKQLKSGLLLVTGPYKINGVPLKRVNQAYVIPTSAKVAVNPAEFAKIEDAFFAKTKLAKAKKSAAEFFKADPKVSASRGSPTLPSHTHKKKLNK